MSLVLVIAGCRFVDLDDGPVLRQRLWQQAEPAGLKGTVLIAPEGINLSLAGTPSALEDWLARLQCDPRFENLDRHRHHAAALPFKRLRVKLKPEIIRMDQPALRPRERRAPAVGAATLQRWLDRIRCEKAALWMQAQGLALVWQPDGGIHAWLRHARAVTVDAGSDPGAGAAGAAATDPAATHWRGRCFVFDERVSVD